MQGYYKITEHAEDKHLQTEYDKQGRENRKGNTCDSLGPLDYHEGSHKQACQDKERAYDPKVKHWIVYFDKPVNSRPDPKPIFYRI